MARALLAEMRSVLVEPNGHTYLALIDVYKTARDPDGAKHAWRHMREAGVRPVSPAVSSVMSVLAKKGDLSAAEELLQEARGLGLNPTTIWYNCLLDAAHIAGDADAAFRILSDMKAARATPDVISYNCALGALEAARRPASDRARLLQEMKSDGVAPNSLFLERHVCYALGLQFEQSTVTGADELRAKVQDLPAEVRQEALDAIYESSGSNVVQTKLVGALRNALERFSEPSRADVLPDKTETNVQSGDWVKVLGADSAMHPADATAFAMDMRCAFPYLRVIRLVPR
ncbi:unnamed protein product [Symbiodinium pilosum]|uniref:Pentacotripeptide-repeat region of PRORP domain-containing protein n=1 Tax=Symbiodinium pilosum TaxID=2952 RepID=A0A812WIX3_SYMPI|nr:unnamed protein product [Symbiodinium pilosum]